MDKAEIAALADGIDGILKDANEIHHTQYGGAYRPDAHELATAAIKALTLIADTLRKAAE